MFKINQTKNNMKINLKFLYSALFIGIAINQDDENEIFIVPFPMLVIEIKLPESWTLKKLFGRLVALFPNEEIGKTILHYVLGFTVFSLTFMVMAFIFGMYGFWAYLIATIAGIYAAAFKESWDFENTKKVSWNMILDFLVTCMGVAAGFALFRHLM